MRVVRQNKRTQQFNLSRSTVKNLLHFCDGVRVQAEILAGNCKCRGKSSKDVSANTVLKQAQHPVRVTTGLETRIKPKSAFGQNVSTKKRCARESRQRETPRMRQKRTL